MHDQGTIEIPISKQKASMLFLACLVFVIIGLWFVASPGTFVTMTRSRSAISVGGFLSSVVFGFFGVVVLKKMFDKRPGLIISEQGITDNSSGVSAGFIPWLDITAIREKAMGTRRFFNVIVKNPQEYIDRQRSGFKRKIMQKNYDLFRMPITISTNFLKISHEELKQILRERLIEKDND